MQITLVRTENVDQVWPSISERLAACTVKAETNETVGALWAECRSGSGFLIVAHEGEKVFGVTVWRFADKYFQCAIIAGEDAGTWFDDLLNFALEIARSNGCAGIGGTARMGLVRRMKKAFPQMKIIRQTYIVEC